MRGRYIYGGKAEKPQKCGGKPEKGEKFCVKPEKEVCQKPENDIFESRKTGKIENICGKRKTFFENCENRKAVLKSCGKPENTQKTMKSGGKPENRGKSYGKPEKHNIFRGKPETDPLYPRVSMPVKC